MMGKKGDRRRLADVDEKEAVTVSTGDWSEDWTDDWSEDQTDDWVTEVKTGLIVAAFVVAGWLIEKEIRDLYSMKRKKHPKCDLSR
jgi:uncharacterized membrane protein YcjF (UPF0283 family)